MIETTLPPFVPWDDFAPVMRWRQGEHVSIVGPTGVGKTTLANALLPMRTFVVVVGTKARDTTLDALKRDGWRRIKRWPPRAHERRVLLWPKLVKPEDRHEQAAAIRDALDSIFVAGGWCVSFDETRYVSRNLGCEDLCVLLATQGRGLGISCVNNAQRPAWVPRETIDQATHHFLARQDRECLRRFDGVGGVASSTIVPIVATLPRHEFLYVNAGTGDMIRTKVTR